MSMGPGIYKYPSVFIIIMSMGIYKYLSKWGYLSEGDDTFQGVVLLHYKW